VRVHFQTPVSKVRQCNQMRSDVDVCDSIHQYTTSSLGSPVSYIWIQYMSSLPHVSMDAYRCTSYEAEDTLTCFFTPRDAGGETTRTCTYSRTSRVLEEAFVTVQYSVQMCACTFAATVVCSSRQQASEGSNAVTTMILSPLRGLFLGHHAFGLVWARALVLLFDITSLQHLPQSPVNAMAGIFCLCV
jgi:hypothetical protein